MLDFSKMSVVFGGGRHVVTGKAGVTIDERYVGPCNQVKPFLCWAEKVLVRREKIIFYVNQRHGHTNPSRGRHNWCGQASDCFWHCFEGNLGETAERRGGARMDVSDAILS